MSLRLLPCATLKCVQRWSQLTFCEYCQNQKEKQSQDIKQQSRPQGRLSQFPDRVLAFSWPRRIFCLVYKTVNAKQAAELLASTDVDIVDVREVNEWLDGHLSGSRLVPLATFRRDPKAELGARPVLFVCAAGMRSETAARAAASVTKQPVYNLSGGTRAWVKAGYALQTESAITAAE